MKTFQDCKEKITKSRYGYTWSKFIVTYNDPSILFATNLAAELYGRYMRFVGRAEKAREIAAIKANPELLRRDKSKEALFTVIDEYHTHKPTNN